LDGDSARNNSWQTGRLADWQTGRLADWQTGRLADWQTGRLADWQTGRQTDKYMIFAMIVKGDLAPGRTTTLKIYCRLTCFHEGEKSVLFVMTF